MIVATVPFLARGQNPDALNAPNLPAPEAAEVLTPEQWQQVRRSIERALAWLATQQEPNGRFRGGVDHAQPAITSLCVMAYLAAGYLPGRGPYGARIEAGIDFAVACQHPDGLLLAVPLPTDSPGSPALSEGAYNHPICGVMLGEVYGMTGAREAARVRGALEKAVQYTRYRQTLPKRNAGDQGGWRYYIQNGSSDSDISLTAWQLMFLRSAKNAGFEIPPGWIEEAMDYTRRCFDAQSGTFLYGLYGDEHRVTRGMAGAGILSLSLGGLHQTAMARSAGAWLLRYPFDNYNHTTFQHERYHYGLYYCSQAMFQLGGKFWAEFYPRVVRTLLANQNPEGAWAPENNGHDDIFGNAYTTALMVLALSTPYQLLPIYQR